MIVDYTERSIYRMTHYSNVCDVLQHGICSSHHPDAHPETYFNIGNPTRSSNGTAIESVLILPVAVWENTFHSISGDILRCCIKL